MCESKLYIDMISHEAYICNQFYSYEYIVTWRANQLAIDTNLIIRPTYTTYIYWDRTSKSIQETDLNQWPLYQGESDYRSVSNKKKNH